MATRRIKWKIFSKFHEPFSNSRVPPVKQRSDMRKLILLSLLLMFLVPENLIAQQKVLPITVEEKPNEFYAEQVRLWTEVTQKDPQNVDAWWNLYLAARYKDFPAIFSDSTYKKEVKAMVESMGKAIPDSYEYNYIFAWNNGFGEENFEFLMRAYKIDSSRPKILEDLFTHYHRAADWETADYYLKKWYDAKSMAPQLLYFCYNLLASTEKDGILFLAGDNDSYPTYMLQTVKKFRPDVAALNVYLIQNKEYTRKLLKKYQLKADEEMIDTLGQGGKDVWVNTVAFIRHLAKKNPGRKVYLPTTMIRAIQEQLEDDLYLVGAVFQYAEKRFDNIAVLKRNWRENLHLDYLDMIVYADDYHYSPKGLPYTWYIYLYPSAALYNHYKAAGESREAAEMLAFAKKIAIGLGNPELYKDFIEVDGKRGND